jgi:hypothetical protein
MSDDSDVSRSRMKEGRILGWKALLLSHLNRKNGSTEKNAWCITILEVWI